MIHLLVLLLGVTATVPSEVRVAGTEMSVGDVVLLSGDPAEVAAVQGIPLGYAPAPGFSRLIGADALGQLVRARVPSVAVTFDGASVVRVLPHVETVAAAEIEAAARALLESTAGGHETSIALAGPVQGLEVPVGDRPYELQASLVPGSPRQGLVPVSVRVLVGGAPYRTVRTTWTIETRRLLPVLVRDVAAGQPIGRDALELRTVRLVEAGADPLTVERILGNVAARPLAAGSFLTAPDVVRPVLVERGAPVTLEVRKGPVIARVGAVAREEGARGDRVRVLVADREREMTGVVLARDLVRIDLGN